MLKFSTELHIPLLFLVTKPISSSTNNIRISEELNEWKFFLMLKYYYVPTFLVCNINNSLDVVFSYVTKK